jgi:hypothetical protein
MGDCAQIADKYLEASKEKADMTIGLIALGVLMLIWVLTWDTPDEETPAQHRRPA